MIRRASAACLLLALTACSATPADHAAPAATTDVVVAPAGEIAHLSAVRVERHDGADRVVLDFTDRVPGYTVGYRPLPARADASGFEIPLPGAAAMLQIALNPATAAGWAGGEVTYAGPSRLRSSQTAVVTEVAAAGDFEAVLTWVVGLDRVLPFRVSALDGPARLTVEFPD